MEIINRIEVIKNKLDTESNHLSYRVSKEKSRLHDIIKLNFDSSINLYNLKSKIDVFYKEIDIDFCENKINFNLDKEFIYYFSIFNNFEYIILLYLYVTKNFNLAYSKRFNTVLSYLENTFSKKIKNIKDKFLYDDNSTKDYLFLEISKYLEISILKKNDVETIKQKFKEYEKDVKRKIQIDKGVESLQNFQDIKNDFINKSNTLKKEINLTLDLIKDKTYLCDKLNNTILDLKKKITEQRISQQFEKKITKYNLDMKEYNELKERKELLTGKIKVCETKLQNILKSKEIKPKLRARDELLKKIKILGEKPKLASLLNEINEEIDKLKEKNSIDLEILNNNKEILSSELFTINSKLSIENEIEIKDKKKDILNNKKSELNVLNEEKKILEKRLAEYNYEYSNITKSLKEIEIKDTKNKIKILNSNKKFINELKILEELEKNVTEYIQYLIYKENKKNNVLKIISFDNLLEIINYETNDLVIEDNEFHDLLEIFKWKMNINLQIEGYLYLGLPKNQIVNGINFKLGEILVNKKKILFNNEINRNKFIKSFFELKNLKHKMSEVKELLIKLNEIDRDVKILKKF